MRGKRQKRFAFFGSRSRHHERRQGLAAWFASVFEDVLGHHSMCACLTPRRALSDLLAPRLLVPGWGGGRGGRRREQHESMWDVEQFSGADPIEVFWQQLAAKQQLVEVLN